MLLLLLLLLLVARVAGHSSTGVCSAVLTGSFLQPSRCLGSATGTCSCNELRCGWPACSQHLRLHAGQPPPPTAAHSSACLSWLHTLLPYDVLLKTATCDISPAGVRRLHHAVCLFRHQQQQHELPLLLCICQPGVQLPLKGCMALAGWILLS